MEKYTLPELPYGYKDLEPYMSEEQLTIHHTKHHQGYVNGANSVLEKLEKEEGVRLESMVFEGKTTFKLQHLRDLMLTKKTKLFKIGVFIREGDSIENILGKVV